MGLGECMRLKSHANIGNFCIYNLLMTSGFFFDHLISIEIKVMKESRDVIEDYTQISYIHTLIFPLFTVYFYVIDIKLRKSVYRHRLHKKDCE